MLTLEQVRVQLGEFELDADFSVEMGSITAVIGPSGGGKSTLLNSIAGFVQPRSGRVLWGEDDLTSIAPGSRPVSMIFQDNNLFPHMSAFDNVSVGLSPSMKLSASDQQRIIHALKRVGLGQYSDRKPAALSGGQQSRVALARILVRNRPLLLLDEPFAALGPALRIEMLDLVAELAQETRTTVLMVTHDPVDAKQISARTVFVADGLAAAPVATDQLFANPPKALRAYLG